MRWKMFLFLVGLMLVSVVGAEPSGDSWAQLSASPSPIFLAGAAAAGGVVYVAGGYWSLEHQDLSLLAYTPTNDSWRILSPMPTPRQTLGVAAIQGKIFTIGGDLMAELSNKTEVYNPSSNSWTEMRPMPVATSGFAYASVNSTFYVMGGVDSNGATRAVWAFNATSNSWSAKAPMPGDLPSTGGANGAAISINGKIYVAPNTAHGVTTSLVYDIASDKWTGSWNGPAFINASGATISMDFYALSAMGDRIFMLGGFDSNSQAGATKYNFAYDTATDSWTRWKDMPTARAGLVAVTLNRTIYAVGGSGSCDPTTLSGSCVANEAYVPAEDSSPVPPPSNIIGGIPLWVIGPTIAVVAVTSIGLLCSFKKRHS